MLVAVSPPRKDPKPRKSATGRKKPAARRKPTAKATAKATAKPTAKPTPKATAAKRTRAGRTFATELAALLRSRKLKVPRGLADAPPEAYGHFEASRVEMFADVPDDSLVAQAEKVAGWSARQRERADTEWQRSPLIAEIRRRDLKAPPPPAKVVGVSVSLRKPLRNWSDAELLRAAKDWSDRGRA